MKTVISGSAGLVGSPLALALGNAGDEVLRLVRRPPRGVGEIEWSVEGGPARPAELEGVDAVVHLAGENIASGRWTRARMARIKDSRVVGTRRLAEALAGLERPPGVLVCASAIGFYGNRGPEVLTEASGPGTGFLPEVCVAWEDAVRPAAEAGIRVVRLRIGIVLSKSGGALERMLLPFRLGLGGRVGNGRQYWSWIALDDLVAAIRHALATGSLHGPVNAVSPQPVTNWEFTRVLGRVLRRPTIAPMPAPAARILLGRMADELLLASTRVAPRELESSGFAWKHPDLEGALRAILGAGGE